MTRRRVLVVAMADSGHTAHWLTQFRDDPIDLELFPSTPHRKIHPLIKQLQRLNGPMRLHISPGMRSGALPLTVLDLLCRNRMRAAYLSRRLIATNPQVVHALECQHAGYILRRALVYARDGIAARRIVSTWGSDLYWFQRFPRHRVELRELLVRVDHLVVECHRDVAIARELGYRGVEPTIIIASGGVAHPSTGLHVEEEAEEEWLSRGSVVVKGYSAFVGRSDIALRIIESLRSELLGFTVEIFAASWRTLARARVVAYRTGLRLVIHRKHALTSSEVREMWRRARLYLAVSQSDGVPASAKEAILHRAVVVHSNTSCLAEHLGQSAVLEFDPSDIGAASALIRSVLIAPQEWDAHTQDARSRLVEAFGEERVRSSARAIYGLRQADA